LYKDHDDDALMPSRPEWLKGVNRHMSAELWM